MSINVDFVKCMKFEVCFFTKSLSCSKNPEPLNLKFGFLLLD